MTDNDIDNDIDNDNDLHVDWESSDWDEVDEEGIAPGFTNEITLEVDDEAYTYRCEIVPSKFGTIEIKHWDYDNRKFKALFELMRQLGEKELFDNVSEWLIEIVDDDNSEQVAADYFDGNADYDNWTNLFTAADKLIENFATGQLDELVRERSK